MSSDTDLDLAFSILLGKAAGVITPTTVTPPTTTGGTTTTPVAVGIEYVIDGGGVVITAGSFGGLIAPFDFTITQVELQEFDGITGSITVDLRAGVPGNSPSFASLCGGNPPHITGGRHFSDSTLTGWSTFIDRGDALQYVVTSVATIKRVTFMIYARRTDV